MVRSELDMGWNGLTICPRTKGNLSRSPTLRGQKEIHDKMREQEEPRSSDTKENAARGKGWVGN